MVCGAGFNIQTGFMYHANEYNDANNTGYVLNH